MKKIVFLLQAFMLIVAIHSNLLAKDTNLWNTKTWWTNEKVIKDIKDGLKILRNKSNKPWVWHKYEKNPALTMAGAQVTGKFISAKYGTLQNVITNLQIPSGTISTKLSWEQLIYKSDTYLINAKDVYDYYFRLYQLFSLREHLSSEFKNGKIVLEDEHKDKSTFFTTMSLRKPFWNGWRDTSWVLHVYSMGDERYVRKAYFNYILFTGTMLNPLSNKSYANRYFLKYKQRWQRMRQLLNKIKNKEI